MENLTNIVESKVNDLANKVELKTGRLAGVVDGDTSKFLEDGTYKPQTIREASDTIRYDANENEHQGFTSNKSDYAMKMQKELAGRLFNKPTNEVTQQDMYDVGNMQTIQKTADMYRSAGEPRWQAPLISGSVKPDLSMVDVPIQVKVSDKVDANGRHLESFVNPSTGVNITEEAANDPRLNAFKKPMVDPRTLNALMTKPIDVTSNPTSNYSYVPNGTDDGSAVNDIMPGTRLGIGAKAAAAPGAFVGSVVGGIAGVADFLTGGRVIGGDKVEALQDAVGKKLGYDKVDFQYEDAVKQKLMEETFDKVKLMNPDTYGNVDWNKAGELFKEGITDPIMLAQSLGLLVGGGGAGGAGIKAGIGLVSKGEKVVAAANKSKAAIMASKELNEAEKLAKVADVEQGITLADKMGAFAANSSGAMGYGASITSQDMAEYAKNNNGELPGFARTMGMFVANTLAVAVPELATTKFELGMNKAMNEKMQGLVSSSIGKAFAHLTMGGVVELPQETIQAVIQDVNQKWGTDKYKGKTIGEVVNESTTDILGQGLLGTAGGVQMASPKAVGYAAKIGEGKLGSILDNQERENANLQRATNLDAINEIKADAKAHIDKASNIMTGLDTGFDMGDRSTADVISDYVGRTSQTFSDAGIQNPEKFAYDLVARRSIQKALDSGSEETMNKVHDTIQELHNSGKVDASELLKNDTQNIMDHFGEVLTKLNKDLKDKSDKEASVLINESNDKIQGIVSQLKARQEMYGNIRGSDGSELPAMTSLEDAIKIASDYQANKDMGVVGKEIMERGFTSINPFTGEIRDDKASINAYKEAALGALNGSKIGDDSLKVNTNIANSLVSNFASPTNLSNLDKFAESRVNKLNPTASKTTKYNTESHLNSMLDENNAILDAANAIKQSAESSKLVKDENKTAYGNKLDAIIAKTNAANAEIGKRLDAIAEAKKSYTGDGTLSYVQRHDGTSGVYEGFSLTKDGKETGKQITDTYKGKSNDVASLQKQVDSWQAQLDKLHTDAMDTAGMTAKRQQFVDSLTSKIADAKQKIESLIPSMSKVEELYMDKVYADFMAGLNTEKNVKIYEAAIEAQDKAIIDGKPVDEIKTIVSNVIKSFKKEYTTTEEQKIADNIINKALDIVITTNLELSKEDSKAELEDKIKLVIDAIEQLPKSSYPSMSANSSNNILDKLVNKLAKLEDELNEIEDTYKELENQGSGSKVTVSSKVNEALIKAEKDAKNRAEGEDKSLSEYEQNKIRNEIANESDIAKELKDGDTFEDTNGSGLTYTVKETHSKKTNKTYKTILDENGDIVGRISIDGVLEHSTDALFQLVRGIEEGELVRKDNTTSIKNEDTTAAKTSEELKSELITKTNELWSKYEDKLGEYKDLVDSIEDVNLEAGLKIYKANVQKELDKSKSMLAKWKAKLDDKMSKGDVTSLDKLVAAVLSNYVNPMFAKIKTLIDKTIAKFKTQVSDNIDRLVEVTGDLEELQALTKAYNDSIKETTKETNTPVGKVVKRVDGAFGPEVEVDGTKTKVNITNEDKFTLAGKDRKDPLNTAMNRIINEQIRAEIDSILDKGGIEGELLVNIMGDNYLTEDKKLFRVTDPGFLGSKAAKELWTKSAEDIIASLPEDFRGFFGKNEEAKKELEANVEVLKEFISKISTVDMQEAMYKGEYSSAKELFKVNPETGIFEAVVFHKVYREKDIEQLKADGKYKGQKVGDLMFDSKGNPIEESAPKSGFNALSLLGKKELVKSTINGKQVTTGVKITMPDRFNDMLKFYSAKIIADIGSLASEIAYEDDSETAKRYGVQGDALTGLKELAKSGQIPLVSVLSEPARAIYKQLGIKGTALMPEVTEEAIISSIEALLAASVTDNGLVKLSNYETINGKIVEGTDAIKSKLAEGKLVSDKSYRIVEINKEGLPVDRRELVASINKLQYISSSRDRKPPTFKANKDRYDRTMMKSDVPVSELSNDMLNKQEKIPYTLDLDGIKKYMDMSDEDALMALGWKSTDGLHISEVKKRESINDKIEREWDILKSYYHILGDKKFYLPWGQTISGRDTLVTDLNFQESKLHREFVLAEGKATELDVKALVENPLSNKALIGGVNQGLDLDPDKLSNETTEKVFKEMWKITKEGVELLEGEEADKIRDMWENPNDPKAIAKVFHETEGHHGVKAVETMKKLDESIKAGDDKVKVTLGVETDAITSGMILTLIQIGTAAAIRLAEKGGLYTKESLAKHTAYVKHWLGDNVEFTPGALIEAGKAHAKAIEANTKNEATTKQLDKLKGQASSLTDEGVFKDLYSTIGIAMVKDVTEFKKELEAKLEAKPDDKKLIRQKMLLDEIGELTLSNVRKIAKSPVMVYIYGAEINSIKQKLVYSLGVDTLVKKIKDLRKAIIAGNVEEADRLREFVYKYVKNDAFETVTGSKVWPYEMKDGEKGREKVLDAKGKPVFTEEYKALMELPEEDRLLHVSLEKATELLSKDIKDSFGKAIENAFKDNLSFVDDNRNRIKAVELMTFEAYKVLLKQKITDRLAEKGIKDGGKSYLSKEDLEDIQAQMLDEGLAHVATINPEGDEQIHQPLKNDSAKQSLEDMATVHRIIDGKPKASNANIKVRKEMAGTGAAPTITIHMQDGTVMRKTLTLDGDKWRGDNVYDAIITGLDSALMEANSKTYNTEVVNTVFDRSILADNVWKLEHMLNAIKQLPAKSDKALSPYEELVHNMSLDGASNNSGLVNDKQRLGLGTNSMIDVLKDAIELSKERQGNSSTDYYVAHTFNYGYANPVTEVPGNKVRSKAIASLDNTNKLLEDVLAKDMKEKKYTISIGTGKGKKLPKNVSGNDIINLEDEVTDNWVHKGAVELLKKAIEAGATIYNPSMIKDKGLKELWASKNSAGAKSEKGTINPIKDELVRLMNEHKDKPLIVNSLKEIMKLAEGC